MSMLGHVLMRLLRRTAIPRKIKRHFRRLNYTRQININGVRLRIPHILGVACTPSEAWMVELLHGILREKRGVFVDIGANVGQTLVKVKALDSARTYIGFEPNPACVFYLQELIAENALEHCTIVPVALFGDDGVHLLEFFSDKLTDTCASMIAGFRPNQPIHRRTLVPSARFVTVEALFQIDRVAFVKIDVEGAELEVVRTLLALIDRDRPTLLLEVLPVYSAHNAFREDRQDQLIHLLTTSGYTMFRVMKTSGDRLGGFERLDSCGVHSDLKQCDYVVIPNEELTKCKFVAEYAM